jgi:hypothetical protein
VRWKWVRASGGATAPHRTVTSSGWLSAVIGLVLVGGFYLSYRRQLIDTEVLDVRDDVSAIGVEGNR